MAKKIKIALINYEVGNTCSVKNAFENLNDCEVILTDDPEQIYNSDAVVLPGVGAFADAVKALDQKNLRPVIYKAAFELKKPFLGVCVGMQLLFEKSEEAHSDVKGLGWIPGEVVKFVEPHFGWNNISNSQDSKIFLDVPTEPNFYFAHSFHAVCEDKYVLAYCDYGQKFPAIVKNNNILGMQFHPEKSHHAGIKLLQNFISMVRDSHA
jgi:imidazole glycerol-phosphate synthase subunit HisH